MDNVFEFPVGEVAKVGAGITVYFGTYLITGYVTGFDVNDFGTFLEIKWPLIVTLSADRQVTQAGSIWLNMSNVQAYSRAIAEEYVSIVHRPV